MQQLKVLQRPLRVFSDARRCNVTFDKGMLEAIDKVAKERGLTRTAFLASAARKEIEAA